MALLKEPLDQSCSKLHKTAFYSLNPNLPPPGGKSIHLIIHSQLITEANASQLSITSYSFRVLHFDLSRCRYVSHLFEAQGHLAGLAPAFLFEDLRAKIVLSAERSAR